MKSVIGNGSDLHAINNNPLIYIHVRNNNRYYYNAIQKRIATMLLNDNQYTCCIHYQPWKEEDKNC